jgi:Transglutaminase-like superfamily
MIKNKITGFSAALIVVFIYSCSSTSITTSEGFPSPTKSNGFSKPRDVDGELIVRIKNIKVMSGDSLSEWNLKNDIPAGQVPSLLLWSSKIKNHINQREVDNLRCSISPTDTFTETENGNKIDYWNLSSSLKNSDSIIIARKFKYIDYDYRLFIDKDLVERKWNEIPKKLKEFYTKSEPFLEQTPEMKEKSEMIAAGLINPVEKAYAIFNWVNDSMKYVYPPKKRGAVEALSTLKGDCGQYSDLFIDLARCAGIPARQQSGFIFLPDSNSYHVWSEIYLPTYGWVPVDATDPDGFCHIDNKKLIASVGENIPLKYVPGWATYSNSEVNDGREDFMQLVSIVMSGVKADIDTEIKVLRSEERQPLTNY